MAKKNNKADSQYSISASGEVVNTKEQEQKEYEAKKLADSKAEPTKFSGGATKQAEDTKLSITANRISLGKALGVDIPSGFSATIDATSKEWKPSELTALSNAGFVLNTKPVTIQQKYVKGLDSASNARIDVKAQKKWRDADYVQGPLVNPDKAGKEGFVLHQRAWVPATPLGELVWNNNARKDGQLWHPENKINMELRDRGLSKIGGKLVEDVPLDKKKAVVRELDIAEMKDARSAATEAEAEKAEFKRLKQERNFVRSRINSGTFPTAIPLNFREFGIKESQLGVDPIVNLMNSKGITDVNKLSQEEIDDAIEAEHVRTFELNNKLKEQNRNLGWFYGKDRKERVTGKSDGKKHYPDKSLYTLDDAEDAQVLDTWEKYLSILDSRVNAHYDKNLDKQIQGSIGRATRISQLPTDSAKIEAGMQAASSFYEKEDSDGASQASPTSYKVGISTEDDLKESESIGMGIKEPGYFVTRAQLFAPIKDTKIGERGEETRFNVNNIDRLSISNPDFPQYAGNLQFDSNKLPLLPLTVGRENLNRQIVDNYATRILTALEKGDNTIKNPTQLLNAISEYKAKEEAAAAKKLAKEEKAKKTMHIQQGLNREEDMAKQWMVSEEKRRNLKPGSLSMIDYMRWKNEQNQQGN